MPSFNPNAAAATVTAPRLEVLPYAKRPTIS